MNNSPQQKPWKEMLTEFLSDPTRPNLRRLLQHEAIEDNDLDFKKELIGDAELAKHIISMANKQGGVIIFGLNETESNVFEPVGIENKIDPTDLEKKLCKYLPPELCKLNHIIPASYTESEYEKLKGKTFIIIIIDYDPKYIPFLPLKDGKDIYRNTIYIRKNRASEPANYNDIQDIFNRRVETEYTSSSERKLREHLEELKELYTNIPKELDGYYIPKIPNISENLRTISTQFSRTLTEGLGLGGTYVPSKPNPNYPEENFEKFVARMINVKKNVIEDMLKK